MPRENRYFVYIMASITVVLYVSVTGFLVTRSTSRGRRTVSPRRYRMPKLVYYETFRYVNNAIGREKEIKWRREKKVVLIEGQNPTWMDLAAE